MARKEDEGIDCNRRILLACIPCNTIQVNHHCRAIKKSKNMYKEGEFGDGKEGRGSWIDTGQSSISSSLSLASRWILALSILAFKFLL